jgi:hypothetical protein
MNLNRTLFVPVLAALLAPAAFAAFTQSTPPASWQLSRAQVHALERAQPSVENCEKLEHYYQGRALNYRQQAQEMDALLAQREETAQHAGGKYAQSVDSGQRLRAYYLQMAQEMDSRAQSWEQKRQHLQ